MRRQWLQLCRPVAECAPALLPIPPPRLTLSVPHSAHLPFSIHACCTRAVYVYCLYFAIMTITSVGYGDVSATAFNVSEQIIASVRARMH